MNSNFAILYVRIGFISTKAKTSFFDTKANPSSTLFTKTKSIFGYFSFSKLCAVKLFPTAIFLSKISSIFSIKFSSFFVTIDIGNFKYSLEKYPNFFRDSLSPILKIISLFPLCKLFICSSKDLKKIFVVFRFSLFTIIPQNSDDIPSALSLSSSKLIGYQFFVIATLK